MNGETQPNSMLPPMNNSQSRRQPPAKKKGHRFLEINGFVDFTMSTLRPTAKAVWFVLWRDTKIDGLARAGQKDIARRVGVTDRAVRKAMNELVAAGLLKVVKKGRLGCGSSVYRIRGVNSQSPEK